MAADEGIYKSGYPLGLDTLKKKKPLAAAALPSEDGSLSAYGEFIMYRPKGGIPLIWGGVPAHRKPIVNAAGEVVRMVDVPAKPAAWRYYREFSADQKKALGWFPKNEKGTGSAVEDEPVGGGRPGSSSKSTFAVDTEKELPRTRVGGTHQLRVAQAAKAMREPDWSTLSKADIQKMLPAAISKAKTDPKYQKVVHRMLAALEKNEGFKRLRAFIAERLMQSEADELNERTYSIIHLQKGDDGYSIIEPDEGRVLAKPDDVKSLGRDRKKWVDFLKQWGVDFVVMKGMGRGGSDNEMSAKRFLSTVIEPKQGQVVPIVKGQPEAPPPERVAHAPAQGEIDPSRVDMYR